MEVYGIVIAASEVIRLEDTDGLLFTLYNINLDLYFCILVHGNSVDSWKIITINHCYKFTELKVGALKSSSGLVKILLKATAQSAFYEVCEQNVKKFLITENLKALISVPAIKDSFNARFNFSSKLISYQGFVTNDTGSRYGRFVLDNKVVLYTIFNVCNLSFIKTGSEVFVSNVHLINEYQEDIVLVCCGLSSVRNVSKNEVQEENKATCSSYSNLIHKYALNIFDLLWIERLSFQLRTKFSSLFLEEALSFEINTKFFENILEFFLCSGKENMCYKKLSLIEEYLSYPHTCSAFLENKLSVDCEVFYLSDILEEATNSISWIEVTKNWKFSIRNEDFMVLIGMFYLSSDGTYKMADRTCKLSVVLTLKCTECTHDQSIMEKFENPNNAFVVALQEYDIIFENICDGNGNKHVIQYLRTSCCRLFLLASFYKSHDNFGNFPFQLCCPSTINNSTLDTHVSLNVVQESLKSLSMDEDFTIPTVSMHFFVLNKLWTSNNYAKLSKILVGFMPEEGASNYFKFKNSSLIDEPYNFYETGDDSEFASLIEGMNNLCIKSRAKLGCLIFHNPDEFMHLLSGHIYNVNLKSCDVMKSMSNTLSEMNNKMRLVTLLVTSDMKIHHDPRCEGNYFAEDYGIVEYCSVKEILLKKRISENSIVVGVLVEKKYYDYDTVKSRNLKPLLKATQLLRIRDAFSNDSICVYTPFFPENIHGLLPGTLLELYGFFCSHSQKNNLYLKASSSYNIQVKKLSIFPDDPNRVTVLEASGISNEIVRTHHSNNAIFHSTFQCLFFVVKIVSAEIFSLCSMCKRNFHDNCLCALPGKVNVKVSALIDDGNQQYLAYSSGKIAKKILALDQSQWNCISSVVQMYHKPLKFFDSMHLKDMVYLPIMNQVFYYYCSSKSICRQMLLECFPIPNPDFSGSYSHTVLCKNVIEQETSKDILEFYMKLKQY